MEEWNPFKRLPTHSVNLRTRIRSARVWVKRCKKAYKHLAVLLVIAGIAGEGIFEYLGARAETAVRNFDNGIAVAAQNEATDAWGQVERLRLEANTARANLARITGRPYAVPVINGVARPDLSKSDSQFVLLTEDTRMTFPKVAKGEHENWTLTIAQNSVGQHQLRPLHSIYSTATNWTPYPAAVGFADLPRTPLEPGERTPTADTIRRASLPRNRRIFALPCHGAFSIPYLTGYLPWQNLERKGVIQTVCRWRVKEELLFQGVGGHG
jgi:hypothetical protein